MICLTFHQKFFFYSKKEYKNKTRQVRIVLFILCEDFLFVLTILLLIYDVIMLLLTYNLCYLRYSTFQTFEEFINLGIWLNEDQVKCDIIKYSNGMYYLNLYYSCLSHEMGRTTHSMVNFKCKFSNEQNEQISTVANFFVCGISFLS